MKGREALESIIFKLTGDTPDDELFEYDASIVEKILTEAGWASPETLASEYVRLDKVVEGRTIDCPDIGRLMSCMDCENRHDTRKCKRLATVADLIGGKKG